MRFMVTTAELGSCRDLDQRCLPFAGSAREPDHAQKTPSDFAEAIG